VTVDPNALACLLLTAGFAPPPSSRWANVGRFALALVKLASDVAEPQDAAARHDVVVTRRDTGETVLRLDAAPADTELIERIHHQLDNLTVAEFLTLWGVDPTTLH
jgi:hypothetical protein